MTDTQQKHYLKIAKRFPSLTSEQKQRLHNRLVYWSKLSPEKRKAAREKYQAFSKVPADKREQVRQMAREKETAASSPAAAPDSISSEHR